MDFLKYQLYDFIWYCTDKRRTVIYSRFTENKNRYDYNVSDYSAWFMYMKFLRVLHG